MNANDPKASSSTPSNGSSASKPTSRTVVLPIDLPGQPIQCWTGDVEKVTVLLKKHRDLVFDVSLFTGKTYSIRSELCELYDTRTKKLVHPREEIFFKDGEVLHLWVGRNFKGKILLFDEKNQIGIYEIENFDKINTSQDPSFKPPPINIIIKNDFLKDYKKPFDVIQLDGSFTGPSIISDRESEKFVQVFEVNMEQSDIPREVADVFKHGGEKEIFSSGGAITRNWIINQIVAQSSYASDNKDWIKELWSEKLILKSVTHRNAGKKMYAVLTGSNRARRVINASRYCSTNTKVLAFSFGAGSAAGIRHASWEAAKGNFRGGGLLSMLFTITLDIAEWTADYEERDPVTGKPKQEITDLFIKIGIDIAKNAINSALTACLVGSTVAFFAGAPLLVIIVGTVVVSMLVGWAIDYLDKKYGISEKISTAIKTVPTTLEEKIMNDYRGYVHSITQAIRSGGLANDF